MVKVELTKGIYWVGAVDWNLRDFHGFVTPRGTTYNAYLIVDEKIALVDTVKHDFSEDMLRAVREIVDPGEIDYLVCNHVEMDHSGSIPSVMQIAKNTKVIATERARKGLISHYRGEWPFITVKTGDEIDLGRRKMRFIEAPMLHWPDSMFTYLKEDCILLPNDAFGQHIATSQRFDDEVYGVEDIMGEAAKYYANILMPLASLILKKIDEVKKMGIAINMIAPSHGIIWRSNPQKIIDAYVQWSEGHAEDKVVILYETMWGSTDKMARAMVNGISAEGIKVRLFHLRNSDWSEIMKEILDSKAVLVGSPTLNNGMFPTVSGFLTHLKGLKPKEKISAGFGSYGWGGGAVRAINEELKNAGFKVLEPGLQFQYVPDEDDIGQCVEFGRKVAKQIKEA